MRRIVCCLLFLKHNLAFLYFIHVLSIHISDYDSCLLVRLVKLLNESFHRSVRLCDLYDCDQSYQSYRSVTNSPIVPIETTRKTANPLIIALLLEFFYMLYKRKWMYMHRNHAKFMRVHAYTMRQFTIENLIESCKFLISNF